MPRTVFRCPARVVVFTLVFLALGSLCAAPDLPGAKDHPEVKRLTGSQIFWYKFNAFDELNIPLEPVAKKGGKFLEAKREHVEGAHTVLYYSLPGDASTFEAVHQYASELKTHDFETLWMPGSDTEIDDGGGDFVARAFPEVDKTDGLKYFHSFNAGDQKYAAFKGKAARGGDLYVTVYAFSINDNSGTGFPKIQEFAKLRKGQTVARVDVVETKAMDARMSVVKAEEITDSVAKTGHVAIYGVYFDTDKADLKPESHAALAEMAQAIKAAGAGRKFLIVGHTDNQGAFEYNQGLSARRARAVTESLARDFGLPAASLIPVGVGMAAPVASNNDDAGRAKNRRVEIVAM